MRITIIVRDNACNPQRLSWVYRSVGNSNNGPRDNPTNGMLIKIGIKMGLKIRATKDKQRDEQLLEDGECVIISPSDVSTRLSLPNCSQEKNVSASHPKMTSLMSASHPKVESSVSASFILEKRMPMAIPPEIYHPIARDPITRDSEASKNNGMTEGSLTPAAPRITQATAVARMIPPERNQPIQFKIAPDFFLLILMTHHSSDCLHDSLQPPSPTRGFRHRCCALR